jgi:hypothetical protein
MADADDSAAAREEFGRLIERILEGLRVSSELVRPAQIRL